MENILNVALILTSIALVASIILQSKGAGVGLLTGADSGGARFADRARERVAVDLSLDQVILCARSDGCNRQCLIVQSGQDDNGQLRRLGMHASESVQALAVRQREV